MANIFLDANDTFTLPSTNTDDKIFGRAAGIPGVTEDPRFEGLTCKKVAIQVTA